MLISTLCMAMALLPVAVQPSGISDITFQRVEQTMGFNIFKANLRITKFNRTTAVLNGTFDILIDLDNSYTIQVRSAYSRLGNNQFIEYPMKLAEQPFCHFLNTTYREFQQILLNTSNMTQVGSEGLCPLAAGHYWYKHVTLDPKYMPQVIAEAYWRLTGLVVGPQGTADLQIFMTVTKDWGF